MAGKANSLVLLNKVKSVSHLIPSADILSTMNVLVDAHKENLKNKRDIALIDAKKDLLVREMSLKYDLYYKVFGQIFTERKQGIDKSFEIIDKGLKENDRELISMGLGSLSQIVSSSPFSNLAELSKLLSGDNVIEI